MCPLNLDHHKQRSSSSAKPGLNPFGRFDDLAVRESRLLHAVERFNEQALLPTAPLLQGDYPLDQLQVESMPTVGGGIAPRR